ncbi:MAG TPA: YqfO family protein [Cellvibrio sp.]|nr:YqfO family protein [Cellvibrio sp.]
MYKLVFFVPETHLEPVKAAVFAEGAGRMGNYDQCCWQVLGDGQYRPLSGSNPFMGSTDRLERVKEYRVEMVCDNARIKPVVAALRNAHPYEEVAFDLWPLTQMEP